MARMGFEAWMAAVDRAVMRRAGVSASDLADMPYRDWHEDGVSPADAARKLLIEEGW